MARKPSLAKHAIDATTGFGTIAVDDESVVWGELIDPRPVISTSMTNSTSAYSIQSIATHARLVRNSR